MGEGPSQRSQSNRQEGTLRRKIRLAAELPVSPGRGRLEITDRSVPDQLADPVKIRVRMAQHPDLGGEFVPFRQPVRPDHPGLLDQDGEGLLTINMQPAVERPVGDERMVMVGRANDDRIEVLLLKALAPIRVSPDSREALEGIREEVFIHITERHDIIVGDGIIVRLSPPHTPMRAMLSLLFGDEVPAMMPLGRISIPALASVDELRNERRFMGSWLGRN